MEEHENGVIRSCYYTSIVAPGLGWNHKFGTDHDWWISNQGYAYYGFETRLGNHRLRIVERKDSFEASYLSVTHYLPLAPLCEVAPLAIQECVDFVRKLNTELCLIPTSRVATKSRFEIIEDE